MERDREGEKKRERENKGERWTESGEGKKESELPLYSLGSP